MFTGIVQGLGTIAWLELSPTFLDYAIHLPAFLLKDLQVGASLSVNGICQTVVSLSEDVVQVNAILETLNCTHLRSLSPHQKVNIERALKMGEEVGGHLLSGHIIGTVKVVAIEVPSQEQRIFTLGCDPKWIKYILPKGFIALNGVSLTVGKVDSQGFFTVNLIPETWQRTSFMDSNVGDFVNLEIDSQTQAIVDTVERVLEQKMREADSVSSY